MTVACLRTCVCESEGEGKRVSPEHGCEYIRVYDRVLNRLICQIFYVPFFPFFFLSQIVPSAMRSGSCRVLQVPVRPLSPLLVPSKREIRLCGRIARMCGNLLSSTSRCKAVTTGTFASVNNAQDPKMEARRGVRMINSSVCVWHPESQIVEFLRFVQLFARIFFFLILRYIIDCDV